MEINNIYCKNKCCLIQFKQAQKTKKKYYNIQKNKAGIIFFDKKTQKILLIQSNSNLWGPPKGTAKKNETPEKCAIREVYEETGLIINPEEFTDIITINNRITYFFVEKNVCNVNIQTQNIDNDATGITWINLDCLKQMINDENIKVTKHTTIILKNMFS